MNNPDNQNNTGTLPSKLNEFEIKQITRFFAIIARIELRKIQDDLRTDKSK
jgi:hypothetical protein